MTLFQNENGKGIDENNPAYIVQYIKQDTAKGLEPMTGQVPGPGRT